MRPAEPLAVSSPAVSQRWHVSGAGNEPNAVQDAVSSAALQLPNSAAQGQPRPAANSVLQSAAAPYARPGAPLVTRGVCTRGGMASLAAPLRTAGYQRPLTATITPACSARRCATWLIEYHVERFGTPVRYHVAGH